MMNSEIAVKELMSRNPVFIDPDDTLEDAALEMKYLDCGILPVGDETRVEGMITDRDIVIRALSQGRDPKKEKVRHYMTAKAYFCNETDTLRQAAHIMQTRNVSRLLVRNSRGEVTGILSFGKIIRENIAPEVVSILVNDRDEGDSEKKSAA